MDQSILDHQNTETLWEYYLLEKLACGLVRDSQKSPTGYEGCLAERFFQESKDSWTFLLKDLYWSDASRVSEQELLDWLTGLIKLKHRHIRFLPQIRKIELNLSERKLKLLFVSDVDTSVLHELSLADASLVPVDYKKLGWIKTVGPYKIKNWDYTKKILSLTANTLSPLYKQEMPQEVLLSDLDKVLDQKVQFNSNATDIVPASAMMDPNSIKGLIAEASQVIDAYPSSVFYLYFNHRSTESRRVEVRKQIAKVMETVRERLSGLHSVEFPFKKENQLIPFGFSGRLAENAQSEQTEILRPLIKKARIRFPKKLKNFGKLFEIFEKAFNESGIQFEAVFGEAISQDESEIAGCHGFAGNQMDSSGSWAFLLGPPHGMLSSWMPEVKNEFDGIFKSSSTEERIMASKKLHQKLLGQAYAVPFMIGHHRYFLSSRVDATLWNKFDARLRMYELRWK